MLQSETLLRFRAYCACRPQTFYQDLRLMVDGSGLIRLYGLRGQGCSSYDCPFSPELRLRV